LDKPGRAPTEAEPNPMSERPYVLLSCAISVDGCLDGPGPARLILSGEADLDRVDGERARSDAIMVGAGTIRRDDPRLLIRRAERRAARVAGGRSEHPAGVTLTASGDLDPGARFFSRRWWAGDTGPDGGARPEQGPPPDRAAPPARLVYAAGPAAARARGLLAGLAEVVDVAEGSAAGGADARAGGDRLALAAVLADLFRRGVRRLMVEGGADLSRQFLTGGLVDELQLAIAPFFVGDPGAPRFAAPGHYPFGPSHRMALAEVREVGAIVLLRYLLAGPEDGVSPAGDRAVVPGEDGAGHD
jgi:5-amino-6-(5-phosphoribosylamino)uracil reductase